MRVRLALNHTYLEEIAALPAEQIVARLAVLRRLRVRADQAIFCPDPFHVHRELATTIVDSSRAPPMGLALWLSQLVGTPRPLRMSALEAQLRQEALWLLQHTRGPFWHDLPSVPDPPSEIEPSLDHATDHARELVTHALGHRSLPGAAPLCIVSPADLRNLLQPQYHTHVSGQKVLLHNLRNDADAEGFASTAPRTSLSNVSEAFQLVEQETGRAIQILPSAYVSAAAYDWSRCSMPLLLQCLLGLRIYKDARDRGLSEEQALAEYWSVTGIEATLELKITLLNPVCLAERTFPLPDATQAVFEPHAKPRPKEPRVHFLWRRLADGSSVVYVGHCGRHLKL